MFKIAAFATLGIFASVATAAPRWDFVAQLDPFAERLVLRGCTPRGVGDLRLRAGDGAAAHLAQMRRADGIDMEAVGDLVHARNWQGGECFRAEIDFKSAGSADRWGIGRARDRYYRVPPRLWFWRPWTIDPESTIRFELPEGWSASVPWTPIAHGTYRVGATPQDWPAQTAFGRFSELSLDLPGGRMRVSLLPLVDANTQDAIGEWFRSNTRLMLSNNGKLPLPDTQVLIVPLPGSESPVPWGQVSRGGAAAVTLFVGAAAGRERWQADWTLAHELAHLQHPYLGDRGRWLAGGLGSYYQNVWRARHGDFSASEGWRRLDAGFARGRADGSGPLLELAGGRGSTMRVYWSGAAYWLESDLALRSHGSSLDAVLTEFKDSHLPSERAWDPAEFIAELDRTVPAAGLSARYREYALRREFPDLGRAYRALGLNPESVPDGTLPAHPLRDAIMAPPAPLAPLSPNMP